METQGHHQNGSMIPAEELCTKDLIELTKADEGHPVHVKVTKLSDVWGVKWQEHENDHGEKPEIDFAYSEPFRFFSQEAIEEMNRTVDASMGKRMHSERSSFIRGIPEMENYLDAEAIRQTCSKLVGQDIIPHHLRKEWTHCNIQLEKQDRPVDKFHYDYVPFVLVTMLRKVAGDKTGLLVLDGMTSVELQPGYSILLQGSHVRHQANQSEAGCRVSLVISLVPASTLHTDMTRIRYRSLPLGEGDDYFLESVKYREARLRHLIEHHPERKERLLDEFSRWLEQLDGCRDPRFFNREVVAMFAAAYNSFTTDEALE